MSIRFALAVWVFVGLFSLSSALAETSSEYRIPLTEKGFNRASREFSKDVKSRTDLYFDFYCQDGFVLKTLSTPMKLRIKTKAKRSEMEFSKVTIRRVFRALETPISFKTGESQVITAPDHLIELTRQFLREIDAPSPRTPQHLRDSMTKIDQWFRANNFPGKRELTSLLSRRDCMLVPSGENTKERLTASITAQDGTELDVKLGKTWEKNGNGELIVRFEAEGDSQASANGSEFAAFEFVSFLSRGQGFTADEVSQEESDLGLWVQAQLRKAGITFPAP